MALTDTAIRKAKPGAKPVKLVDGNGLFLLLQPAGGRCLTLWQTKRRFLGCEQDAFTSPWTSQT